MASGTKVDLDWARIDSSADRARANAGAAPVAASSDAVGTRYLTDEEILGIETPSPNGGYDGPAHLGGKAPAKNAVIPSATSNLSSDFPAGVETRQRDSSGATRPRNDNISEEAARPTGDESRFTNHDSHGTTAMPQWMQAAAADPQHGGEAQQLWREHQEFRSAFTSPEEARAIKELLPGGVRDVLSLREATQSVERIDAALFSGDARAQSEVVAELARVNPAAFRSLFAEAAKVLAGLGAGGREAGSREARNFDGSSSNGLAAVPTPRETGEAWDMRNSDAGGLRLEAGNFNPSNGRDVPARAPNHGPRANAPDSPVTNHPSLPLRASQSVVTTHESQITNHGFDPIAYATFERSTNDAVARDVRGSISDTLTRVLPEGVADGAARRIGEDIFQEIHRALASDRALSEQVAAVLRERRFGSGEQQQVSSLLAGRARQLVPSVARRVIGEWTSSVLNTSRTKAARQAAAASRVDIAAPGGSLDSMPLRPHAAGSARGVDYASMTDEQILGI